MNGIRCYLSVGKTEVKKHLVLVRKNNGETLDLYGKRYFRVFGSHSEAKRYARTYYETADWKVIDEGKL